ncbi:methyltransferase domain-containing protein [Lacrimispora sp. JR3]|uniref:methyltransferase domain-containing protein n=1 Tax=Lacrimispora sinapis TaxID=3111456 RepID=UPI00374A142C
MKTQAEPLKSMEKLYEEAAINSRNYKIYEEMGDHYQEEGNVKRAYLCYVHSHFLCDQDKEALLLSDKIEAIKKEAPEDVPLVTIIIPAVPVLAQMEAVLNASLALKEDCKTVIVLDMEENQEVTNWLHGNPELTVVSAKGLSPHDAYQKAVQKAGKHDDLLLLDRGSALLSHALFHLRMSLYKNEEIGAANAVTNGPAQGLTEFVTPIKRADGYALEHNLPGDHHMTPSLIPTCGSLLVKRDCWDKVNGFDDSFLTLEVAQKDLSFQLLQTKKLTYVCHHGYVYTLIQPQNNSARWFDYNHFYEKWNVRLNYSLFSRPDIIRLITDPGETPLKVLDVGCACGALLLSIKNKYPNADLHGIELDPGSWNIASKLFPVTQGNVEEDLDYPLESFDYIIFGDVLEHLHQPEAVLVNMKRYLKPGGMILASIPNIMHISVLGDLLNGKFTYQDSGILDRTHLRFFTKEEIEKMFSRAGYEIADMGNTRVWISDDQTKLIQTLCTISTSRADEFMAYQYLVKAKKL